MLSLSRDVREGSLCVGAGFPNPSPEGKGKWVIVDSFTDPAVASALKPHLGPPDVARFRFEDFTVEFRVNADKDAVDVKIVAGSPRR